MALVRTLDLTPPAFTATDVCVRGPASRPAFGAPSPSFPFLTPSPSPPPSLPPSLAACLLCCLPPLLPAPRPASGATGRIQGGPGPLGVQVRGFRVTRGCGRRAGGLPGPRERGGAKTSGARSQDSQAVAGPHPPGPARPMGPVGAARSSAMAEPCKSWTLPGPLPWTSRRPPSPPLACALGRPVSPVTPCLLVLSPPSSLLPSPRAW